MMYEKLYYISLFSLTAILGTICVLAYWLFYPYHPLTVNINPMPILNPDKSVRIGEPLLYYTDTCRNMTGTVRVSRTFVDGVLINLPEHTFFQETVECRSYTNSSVSIPKTLPPGEYKLVVTSYFQVNPIREVAVKLETEKFTVTQ